MPSGGGPRTRRGPSAVCVALGVGLTVALLSTPALAADPLRVTIDPTTFFEDEPAWLLSVRPALGIGDDGSLWPQLGVGLGYVFPSHFFLALHVDGRLTAPEHVRGSLRFGAVFRRKLLNIGFGSSLSVLAIPGTREVGPVPTTWLDVSLRLRKGHYLTLFAEADVLVEQLGFDDSRAMMGFGVGWTLLF